MAQGPRSDKLHSSLPCWTNHQRRSALPPLRPLLVELVPSQRSSMLGLDPHILEVQLKRWMHNSNYKIKNLDEFVIMLVLLDSF